MNYIHFFSVEIPEWMAQSNQVAQTVGFNTDRYWLWVTGSIAEICKKHNDNELVVKQFGLLFEWLEAQAEGINGRD